MSEFIKYSIIPVKPEAHLFEVSITVPEPTPEGQCFSLPNWIPGSYMIRDFSRHIVEIWAECRGEIIAIEKLDKSTWQCEPVEPDRAVTVTYQVYAWDLSVRAAHLDITHGYFNGTSVFLAANGHEDLPCLVDIRRPSIEGQNGSLFETWRVATSMPKVKETPRYGFGLYESANYDELIDHPVEMGNFTLAEFDACGIPHALVLTGRHRADLERICEDLKSICETHIRFFTGPPPMERYVFLVQVVEDGYGGLEHRASTSLLCSRKDLPVEGSDRTKVEEDYRTFLGLCSHEYFHTWNIKRIKPDAYIPYDLNQEVYSEQLWAFEGITSYYDDLALVRSGCITGESYLELLGQNISRVFQGKGRLKQTVTESSYDTWTRFYKQDENAVNAIVSYYTKGALIALCIDLLIRRSTGNEKSLDDVMVRLWKEYGREGRGVEDNTIQLIASEVAGTDLSDFFHLALYTTEDLPLAELLATMDVELHWRARQGTRDLGGKAIRLSEKEQLCRPELGIKHTPVAGGTRVAVVFEDGAAMQAGISAGDVIIAVDGLKAHSSTIDKVIGSYRPGDTVDLTAFRRDELMQFAVTLGKPALNVAWLSFKIHKASAEAARWMGLPG